MSYNNPKMNYIERKIALNSKIVDLCFCAISRNSTELIYVEPNLLKEYYEKCREFI